MVLDSTQDLLSNYQSTHDDNLSLYSISGESNHQLSDLYDMLDDDSIEIRRSQSMTESPFKTSSPLRLSPVKKLRSDYQDHIFRARSGNHESPVKRQGPDLEWPKLSLDDSTSYDSMEQNIDRFLAGGEAATDTLDLGEFEKTELLIKETHKLINNVPPSVSSNKEGEKYSRMLASSLEKIIKSLENTKSDYRALKTESDRSNDKHAQERSRANSTIEKLRTQNTRLEEDASRAKSEASRMAGENARLREEVDQLHRRLSQQVPQMNSQVKKENNLLREKLIKYKNIATDLQKQVDALQQPRSSGSETDELARQIAQHLRVQATPGQPPASRESEPGTSSNPNENPGNPEQQVPAASAPSQPSPPVSQPQQAKPYQLLSLFEELIEQMQARPQDSGPAPELLQRLMTTVDVNNRLFARLMDRDAPQINSSEVRSQHHIVSPCHCAVRTTDSAPVPGSASVSGEVFVEATQGPDSPPQRPACARCSSVRNDTLNLMGEYQWSI